MAGATTFASSGRVTGGEQDATVERLHWRISRNPVVYLHSAAGNPDEAVGGDVLPSVRPILSRLAQWGFETAAPTAVPLFGASTSYVDAAVAYGRTQMGSAGPPVVVGTSSGGAAAIRAAMGDASETPACAVLFIPAIDLPWLYENNPGGSIRSQIANAWDVTYPAPLPADADLVSRGAEADIPILMYVGTSDVVSTNYATFAAAAPNVTLVELEGVAHDDTAIAAVDIDQVIEFIQANA